MCENEKKKYHSIEMTTGSLWKNILLFSLPLMGSQVLEVLFNLSDVAVVGRFADYMALGAVGSTTLLVTLFTGILIGMGAGVNVRVAHELGAGNKKGTEETIHTSFLLCAITGLLVCAICLLFSGRMLSMMNTKPELIDQAILYMKIYSLGMLAMAVYNFGNGVLSAIGDTKRPLIYLSIASEEPMTAKCLCAKSVCTPRPAKQFSCLASLQVFRTESLLLQTCLCRLVSTLLMQ